MEQVLKASRQQLGSLPFSSDCVVSHLKCPETGEIHAINALADTGASDFLVDKSVLDRLRLKGQSCQFTVLGHGGHESVHTGSITAINPESKEEYDMGYYAYEGPYEGMFPEDWSQLKINWPHLKHLEIPPPVNGRHIEAIVSCKYLSLFEASSGEDIYWGRHMGDPVAKKTPLGWAVAGKTSKVVQGQAMTVSGQLNGFATVAGILGDGRPPDYKQLYLQLKKDLGKVWNLETEDKMKRLANCYLPAQKTVLEAQAEATFQSTLAYTELNKYRVGLLWKSDLRPCNNYAQAKTMFLKLEEGLLRCKDKHDAFHQAHQDWLAASYLETSEDGPLQQDQFFLLDFMVEKETSHERSFRYVIDEAQKFQGQCLNDHLLPGQNTMAGVLLRFCRHPHVLTCDIKEMFLGFEVAEIDRKYLKVFYRKSPDQPLLIYQCTRHVFGLCYSPCVAMNTVLHQALKFTIYFSHHLHTEYLRIPRQAIAESELLVIFTDASTQALAAAAYVINDKASGLGPRLVWAKNKLASLKGNETVPRLELGAAVMGTELAFFICKTFGWDLNWVLCFSDSMTVLWWIQSTHMLNPYVADRLQKIAERISYQQWLHVRIEVNPADLPMRGVLLEKLKNHALWWQFLQLDPEKWENRPQLYETEEAMVEGRSLESVSRNMVLAVRATATYDHTLGDFIVELILSIHGFERGCRIADIVRQAVIKLLKGEGNFTSLTSEVLIHKQAAQFTALKGALIRGTIPDQRYWPLGPYLDGDGLIRINGRLTPCLECKEDQARPILLHKGMRIVQPMLWEMHADKLKHYGAINTFMVKIREKYWWKSSNNGEHSAAGKGERRASIPDDWVPGSKTSARSKASSKISIKAKPENKDERTGYKHAKSDRNSSGARRNNGCRGSGSSKGTTMGEDQRKRVKLPEVKSKVIESVQKIADAPAKGLMMGDHQQEGQISQSEEKLKLTQDRSTEGACREGRKRGWTSESSGSNSSDADEDKHSFADTVMKGMARKCRKYLKKKKLENSLAEAGSGLVTWDASTQTLP